MDFCYLCCKKLSNLIKKEYISSCNQKTTCDYTNLNFDFGIANVRTNDSRGTKYSIVFKSNAENFFLYSYIDQPVPAKCNIRVNSSEKKIYLEVRDNDTNVSNLTFESVTLYRFI